MKKFILKKKTQTPSDDLKEAYNMFPLFWGNFNKSMKDSHANIVKSLTTSNKRIIADTDGFPIWDPDEHLEINESENVDFISSDLENSKTGNLESTFCDSEINLNTSQITVAKKSLCEGANPEYFSDLFKFTQNTLQQNSVSEDNVVLGVVWA